MARGGARHTASLKYEPEAYNLDALKSGSLSVKEMESEYRRLSAIANKRLERFEHSKEWHDADIYREYAGYFYKTTSQMTKPELMRELADVSRFVSNKMSSIRGQQQARAQTIATLHEHGYTFVNRKNFKDFTAYMDEVKVKYQNTKYPPSEELYEVYKEARKRGVKSGDLLHDLDDWLENRDQISKLTTKDTKGLSSKKILQLIKKGKKK